MDDLTEIIDGKRTWCREAMLLIRHSTNPHSYLIQGLTEATKCGPISVRDRHVFYVDPIVIELFEDRQVICLVSEKFKPKEFGYSRWEHLFHLIRIYWSEAHVINE